jgi:uncharacterized protein
MNSIITNNEEENKFYIRLDGKEAYLKYELKEGNIMDIKHTYVPKEFRSQDIGQAIVKEALEYAEKNNFKVIPTCRFTAAFIKRNKEYKKLLA